MNANQKTYRIVAAIVDVHQLTMYKEDGTTIVLKQGTAALQSAMEQITTQLVEKGYADLVMDVTVVNSFADFEKKTNGIVRLFRVAKSKLKELFCEPVAPVQLGMVPVVDRTKAEKQLAAVQSIMEHAVPVTSEIFTEEGMDNQVDIVDDTGSTCGTHTPRDATETVVAVMDGKIIPGMEKIKNQFTNAVATNNTIGMENFLKRLANVIDERSHSVEDVLKFLERGDLPIADDGCILIYKVLLRKDNVYVDCHTNKIEQWVGAYVCMDKSLVDPERNNECSNGLHVARRGYIGKFTGNVCVLAKLAPEDVIAVPDYDANKMRVCGYHIIAELTEEQHNLLNNNRPITEVESGKLLLANALAGNHINRTHAVHINGHMGKDVLVFESKLGSETETIVKDVAVVAEALPDKVINEPTAPAVDPKAIAKVVVQQKTEGLSYRQQIEALFPIRTKEDAQKAFDLKRASKKSFAVLGITYKDEKTIMSLLGK